MAKTNEPKKEQPGSKLDKRVQDVISMIFDIKMMERTLVRRVPQCDICLMDCVCV